MKIHLVSDVHTEFAPYPFDKPVGTDVVVAAGDIAVGDKGPLFLREMFGESVPIVYVCGNHEFYRQNMIKTREAIAQEAERLKVTYLENDCFVKDDVVFIGATLWTDFELVGDATASMSAARFGMNDYRLINVSAHPNGWERFIPEHARTIHKESLEYIVENLVRANEVGLKTVVVTHMAPHPNSIHRNYQNTKDQALNASYASDLTKVLEQHKPTLWLHGHVHDSFDYVVGSTRVVANPRGYASSHKPEVPQNPSFKKDLLIEI